MKPKGRTQRVDNPASIFDVVRNCLHDLERTAETDRDDKLNQALLCLLIALEHEHAQRTRNYGG